MRRPTFLAGPDAGLPLRYENRVCHRQIRGRVTAEDELRLDRPVVHLRGWFLPPRDKNSASAWATTAEIESLHWTVDMTFDEGQSQLRQGSASGPWKTSGQPVWQARNRLHDFAHRRGHDR
jgi:hypothetical protein